MSALRALLVAYAFPPVGGVGVQRMAKLAKYLPAHGIVPRVLTVKNPSAPLTDGSLERDLPAGLEIVRARTLEPSYAKKKAAWDVAAERRPTAAQRVLRFVAGAARQLAYPDVQILWQPAAQAALARIVRDATPPDVVLISGPPFSQFLLAPLAHSRAAVVLDYRDEWSVVRSEYEMKSSVLARWIGDPLEAALLRRAHMVTTATEEFRENLIRRFSFLNPASVVAIPNGFDPDDFPADPPQPPSDRFVLSYVGTVFRLTSPAGLLGAIRRLHRAEPDLARLLEVRFIGRVVAHESAAFEGMERLGVRRLGYVEHDAAVRAMAESHLVACILDDVPGVERIYPAKIFEIMYVGRPCLALAPEGALTRLVERCKLGVCVAPRDEEAIAAVLVSKLRAFRDGAGRPGERPGFVGIERFDRRALAGEFAAVMREAVSRAQGRAAPARTHRAITDADTA